MAIILSDTSTLCSSHRRYQELKNLPFQRSSPSLLPTEVPAWGTSNLAPIPRLRQEPWTHLSLTLHLRFPIWAGWGGDKKDRAEMATAGSVGAPLGPSLNLSRPWFPPVHNRNDSAAHTGVCCRDPRGHVCSAWSLLAMAAVRSEFFCQGPHGRARLWGQTWAGILSPTFSHATLFIYFL